MVRDVAGTEGFAAVGEPKHAPVGRRVVRSSPHAYLFRLQPLIKEPVLPEPVSQSDGLDGPLRRVANSVLAVRRAPRVVISRRLILRTHHAACLVVLGRDDPTRRIGL